MFKIETLFPKNVTQWADNSGIDVVFGWVWHPE